MSPKSRLSKVQVDNRLALTVSVLASVIAFALVSEPVLASVLLSSVAVFSCCCLAADLMHPKKQAADCRPGDGGIN